MEIEPDTKPLRPLTKRTVDGKLYYRNAKHEQHIRRALSIPLHELESWIRALGYGEKRYGNLPKKAPSPEALVYLYRHFFEEAKQFTREQQQRALTRVEGILAVLLEGIFAAVASHLPNKLNGVSQDRIEICIAEVEGNILDLLHDSGNAADSLEIVFGKVLRRLSIKAAQRYRDVDQIDTISSLKADTPDLARLLDSKRAMQALEQLTPEQQGLIKVRILQDPPKLQAELAFELGVTERTIRNRERDAIDALREILNEDK